MYTHFILISKEVGDSTEMLLPIDYEALLTDTRYESLVRSTTKNRLWYMNLKMEVKKEMENLIAENAEELKKINQQKI
jgi:hypothetical protein